jgi:DNA helicase-2/ATP-dependent DNA helicase PcrA
MSEDIILQNLNEPQKEAVTHTEGPLLVFAGAGSGKTRVITNRIAYLIAVKKVVPANILAVTFTKKAAEEMQERINSILNELKISPSSRPLIGTFHSIGSLILRQQADKTGLSRNFSIYDSDDTEGLIKDILVEQNVDIKQIRPKAVAAMISSAKNELISPEDFPYSYSGYIEDIVAQVYTSYQKHLKEKNAVDFGDLLAIPVNLLKVDQAVLKKYQDQFKYILVDEYQDTNKAQYEFIKSLAQEHQNLCVVGDDDQGIYAWRGADIKNILSFEKDFSNVKVVKLEQNYRSVKTVIHAAVSVIQRNIARAEKSLWTDKEDGEKITVYQARDPEGEAQYVLDEIHTLRSRGHSLKDMAVLYRTNYQSRAIEEELLRRGIPYKLVGGFRFYERKEVKDIISYLRFTHNIKDDLSLNRIINTPPRKAGPKAVRDLNQMAQQLGCSLGETLVAVYLSDNPSDTEIPGVSKALVKKVEERKEELAKYEWLVGLFGEIYIRTQDMNVLEAIKYVVDRIKYESYIDDGTEAAEARLENIEELKNVAGSYVMKSGDQSTALFLEEITLIEQEQDKAKDAEGNAVTLMTLHASKGLEFPVVFIIGMEEGIMPHSRAFVEEKELEEERRLCYVGITRAKERLYMTFAEGRNTMGGFAQQIPSRFLTEIPEELCEYYSWNS